MSEEQVRAFKTSCGSCVFAINKSNFPCMTQTGCQLGRLEKFIKNGKAELSDNKNHYIINGICNTCRGEEWKSVHIGKNLIASVEKEIQITVDIVLYSVNGNGDFIKDLEQRVNSCVKQKQIKPKKILIVIKNNNVKYQEVFDSVQELTEPYDIPFRIIRVIDSETTLDECVSMGISKCTSQYTAVFDLKHQIPTNFITKFNTLINYDMKRIIMIEPTFEYGGMVLQTNVFKLLGKNYNIPIFEKVKEVASEQEKESMVFTWDKLWNQK